MDISIQLPVEIVNEILLRLPVKSVLRFKTVCKSWYSIIHDTRFAKRHFNLALADTDSNFFSPCYHGQYPSNPLLLYKQDADGIIHARAFDVLPEYRCVSFRNSCHGLLCFFDGDRKQIFVWNPCLPTHVKIIPSQPFPNDEIAFGYDPSSDDYKIVKVPCRCLRDSKYVKVEAFSFKSNSWKSEQFSICTPVDYLLFQALVYANNRVHWFATESYGDMTTRIMYFDVVEGRLKVMNVPPDDMLLCCSLMNYKDSIAIIGENIGNVIEYWVLGEFCGMKSSWKKMFSITCIDSPWDTCCCIGVTLNGESFVRMREGGLRIYDSKEGSLVLGNNVTYINEHECCFFSFPFVQSLLSPLQLH